MNKRDEKRARIAKLRHDAQELDYVQKVLLKSVIPALAKVYEAYPNDTAVAVAYLDSVQSELATGKALKNCKERLRSYEQG